jgi:integration host factor subunit beta
MKRSEFINQLYTEHKSNLLSYDDVKDGVTVILDSLADALSHGDRIEVRGFGSFTLHHHAARIGRNPKTGSSVDVPDKHVPSFRPSQELKHRVDNLN